MSANELSNEIRITRIYDASVETVWDAWDDPQKAAQWWGPRGFTITTHSKDLRTGGSWNYTMHGPDGVDYPNSTHYLEVEKHAKLVYDHGASSDRPALFRVTVSFSALNGKTKMEMSMALPTPEATERTKRFIKKAGGDATWDRLAEFLSKELSGKEIFVINRSFAAPQASLFKMWANPEHFSQWIAPKGVELRLIRSDIKNGGSTFSCMTGEPNVKIYSRADYLKIDSPESLIFTQQFCDENENIRRAPFAPTWPETMLTTVQFTEEGPNQTRVLLRWEPDGATTKAEVDIFAKSKGRLTQGWSESFDKLEEYLLRPGVLTG